MDKTIATINQLLQVACRVPGLVQDGVLVISIGLVNGSARWQDMTFETVESIELKDGTLRKVAKKKIDIKSLQ